MNDNSLEQRKAETERYYRHAERRMLLVFAALIVLSAFFQWLMSQLPDLSSEALGIVCSVLYP